MTSPFGDGKAYTEMTNINVKDTLRIQGAIIGSDGVGRINYVLVKSASDFPTPVGNVIELVDNISYEINGDIILGNGVSINAAENSRFFSINRSTSSITANVAGPLITVTTGKEIFVQSISFTNPPGDLADVSGNDAVAEFKGCGMDTFNDLITVSGDISRVEFEDGAITNGVNGFVLTGALDSWSLSNNFVGIDVSGTLIDLGTSVTDAMNLSGNTLLASATLVLIDGVVDGGNVSSGGIARVSDNNEIGPFTGTLNNITELDDGWLWDGNKRYADTPFTGSMFLQGNATVTNVLSGSYVKVAGTTTEGVSARFSMTASNEITYEDAKNILVGVTVTASVIKIGGSVANYSLGIFRNGTLLPDSVIPVELKNTASSVSVSVTVALATSDTIDLRVQGEGTTDDLTVSSMQFVTVKT